VNVCNSVATTPSPSNYSLYMHERSLRLRTVSRRCPGINDTLGRSARPGRARLEHFSMTARAGASDPGRLGPGANNEIVKCVSGRSRVATPPPCHCRLGPSIWNWMLNVRPPTFGTVGSIAAVAAKRTLKSSGRW
jgi:hypothetical protein